MAERLRIVRWAGAALLGFVMGPAWVLVHEFGHYFVACALGGAPRIHFAEVRLHLSGWRNLAACAGGPLVSLALAIFGVLLVRRSYGLWKAGVALNGGRWLRHPWPNDERVLAQAARLPHWLLPVILGCGGAMTIVWLFWKAGAWQCRLELLCLCLGMGTGILFWLGRLGPALLP